MEENKQITVLPYNEFRPKYDEQHQASIPVYVEPLSDNPRWMTWALLAMFICSALLSGVHTVPTAYNTIDSKFVAEWVRQPVALGVFIFIELGIFFTSYSMFKKWSWIALSILIFCILIAMVANLYSVYHALTTDDLGAQIVGIMFGLAAPLIAMMTGKQYVNFQRADADAILQAKRLYQERKVRYDKAVETAYANYQKRIQDEIDRRLEIEREQIRIEKERQLQLAASAVRPMSNGQAGHGQGYERESKAAFIVREYLSNNPSDLSIPVRELAEKIGVGKSTVANVVRSIKQNG